MKNQNEAEQFITEVLCGLWGRWEPKDVELVEWKKRLMNYDYHLGKKAIEDYFFETSQRTIDPPAGKIMDILRRKAFIQRRQNKRIAPIYVICNQDGKQVWRPFSGDVNLERQNYECVAENRRSEADRLFPNERHYVHWLNTDEPEDEGDYSPGARQRAIDEILNRDDDDKTKRWLQKYLAKSKKKGKAHIDKPKEPVRIGDDIPF